MQKKKSDRKTRSSLYYVESELLNSPFMSPSLLTALSDKQRETALARYQQLAPYLKKEISLRKLGNDNHLALRTARTWIKLYRNGGLVALARKPRNDKDNSRILTPETRHLIEGIYLKSSHLSVANIYRQIEKYFTEKNILCPKYRTVCALLSRLPKSMTTLAHKGNKEYL